MINKYCEQCGKKITRKKLFSNKNARFCSIKCYADSRRIKSKYNCVVCGKEMVKERNFSKTRIRLCSKTKCIEIYKRCRKEYKRYRKAYESEKCRDICLEE